MLDLLCHRTGMLNRILESVLLFFPKKPFVRSDGFRSLKKEGHHQGQIILFRNETPQERREG